MPIPSSKEALNFPSLDELAYQVTDKLCCRNHYAKTYCGWCGGSGVVRYEAADTPPEQVTCDCVLWEVKYLIVNSLLDQLDKEVHSGKRNS